MWGDWYIKEINGRFRTNQARSNHRCQHIILYPKIVPVFFISSFLSNFVPGTSPHLLTKRQASTNELVVIPAGPHNMPVGRNLFFTCKAQVHNPELVRDLRWIGPEGRRIAEDDR